jgi:hypothetical protein
LGLPSETLEELARGLYHRQTRDGGEMAQRRILTLMAMVVERASGHDIVGLISKVGLYFILSVYTIFLTPSVLEKTAYSNGNG